MTSEFSTAFFVVGEQEPEKAVEIYLRDIIFAVKDILECALNDAESELARIHPKTLVSMVITNILVNLLFNIISVSDIGIRIKLLNECLDEIRESSLHLWKSLEASKASMEKAN